MNRINNPIFTEQLSHANHGPRLDHLALSNGEYITLDEYIDWILEHSKNAVSHLPISADAKKWVLQAMLKTVLIIFFYYLSIDIGF